MNRCAKTVLVGIMTMAVILGVQVWAEPASAASIGYVNIQELFNQHPSLPEAQEKYAALYVEVQQELQEAESSMSQEELRQLQAQLQNKLGEKEQQIQQELISDIYAIVAEVASSLQLDIVLRGENVVVGGQDITEEVLAKY